MIATILATVALLAGRGGDCFEDDPCWHWPTMGNHTRGVTLDNGRELVVGPCRFSRLARRGRLDSDTPRLKGDRWAIRHGCC